MPSHQDMTNLRIKYSKTLFACLAVVAMAAPAMAQRNSQRRDENNHSNPRMAVTYPWLFTKGTDTARATALSTVEDARTEFSQQRSRLQAADEADGDVSLPDATRDVSDMIEGGRPFSQWVQIGFAVTLPLIIFGVIALVLFMWMASKP